MLYYVYGSTARASEKPLKSDDSCCVVRGERKRKHDFTAYYFTLRSGRHVEELHCVYIIDYRLYPCDKKKNLRRNEETALEPRKRNTRSGRRNNVTRVPRGVFQYRYQCSRYGTIPDELTYFDLHF